MIIIKRDGSHQEMMIGKIQRAMIMAFQGTRDVVDVMPLVHRVVDKLREGKVDIERIAATIEDVLMDSGWHDVARRFIRYRAERDRVRAERLRPSPSGLTGYIHVAKYARWMASSLRREIFSETVSRSAKMHIKKYPQLEAEIRAAFNIVQKREGMPSMRGMQFAGEAIEKDNARIYNCSFGHISDWRRFQEMFYLLLCGCGVGYSVQWRHIDQLDIVIEIDAPVYHYTIEDSIIGWADALGALIECYTVSGRRIEFNYSLIRDEGAALRTSGGRAPGHLPLKRALEAIRGVLDGCVGRRPRPIEAHDMMCHLAEAVLAGGIRRSAMICLFSVEDTEMMFCKTRGVFRPAMGSDPGLEGQREMANNSACLLRPSKREILERIVTLSVQNYGCPGFYLTGDLDYGPNPCGEIGMWPMIDGKSGISFCNLTEVNVSGCDALGLMKRVKAMALIGTLQAGYTAFPYLGEVTEAICRREALLGVSLTGIMDNVKVGLDPRVLKEAAAVAVAENKRVAALIGIRPAARVTTIKPSGTASLELGGVSSGIHPRWSRRYIHRVTANPLEGAARFFREHNPHMIEEKPNGDWCIMFPIQAPDGAITVKELSADAFIDSVMTVYDNWILPGTALPESAPGLTHNVSCTVVVRDGELDGVIERIWIDRDRISAMSFVPYLIDKKFRYAPRQAIGDEDLWNRLIRLYREIDWSLFYEDEDGTSLKMGIACGPSGDC